MMASHQTADLAEQFRQFIIGLCNTDPGFIEADGKWHRFNIADTRHKSSKPGRYLMHADGKANGLFMDWREGGKRHQWFADGKFESVDRDEIARRREHRRIQQLRAFQAAAEDARDFWASCSPLTDGLHPYLQRKGVLGLGTRQGSGERFGLGDAPCVIVPLSNGDNQPMSLQAIREDGERRFWPGSTHEGAHFLVGKDDGTSPVVFCEGLSTAASVRDATGFPVVMCVTSSNMAAVARWAAHRWAGRDLIVAGDDDWHLLEHPKIKRNVGKEAATNMARSLGARLVMPNMAGLVTDGGDDFNDMAREYGVDEVRALFATAASSPSETPLPLIWYDDNRPLLTGNWIIKNLMPAEAFMTIIGHPGCGKSFLALDLALHVAAGMPWQDRKTKQGLVIYLAAEGQRGQQNRVEAWKRHYEAQGLAFAMIPVAVNLRDREADIPKLAETIRAACAVLGITLAALVVDTLNRTFGGGDENGSDMSEYVDNVGRLKAEFGCTTIVVHHIPKTSENGAITERGHGSLRGAIETSLVVSQDAESGLRTIKCTKQKDAEDGWSFQFRLKVIELGEDEDGDPVTSCVVVSASGESTISRPRGPSLSATQRQVYNELLGTLEASAIGVPRDIPDDQINRLKVGKVVDRKTWQSRWIAIGAPDASPDTARRTFQRAVNDLHLKKLVGVWNDHAWATHE